MISASEARANANKAIGVDLMREYKKDIEKQIKKAMSQGRTQTCFYCNAVLVTEEGKQKLRYPSDADYYELRRWLQSNGYRIIPTGYLGGVLQDTEEIAW